jgi:hypothetical protein
MWVLTVFGETYSSLAISDVDKLVGRSRSTRISRSLSGDLPVPPERFAADHLVCMAHGPIHKDESTSVHQ